MPGGVSPAFGRYIAGSTGVMPQRSVAPVFSLRVYCFQNLGHGFALWNIFDWNCPAISLAKTREKTKQKCAKFPPGKRVAGNILML